MGESLLVLWIVGPGGLEWASVESGLNIARDCGTIRVAAMKQQFSRAQPARIEIGKSAARPSVHGRIRYLVRHQHPLHVQPHACGAKRGAQNHPCGIAKDAGPLHEIYLPAMGIILSRSVDDRTKPPV